jgi:hypothetical protein
VNTDNTELLIAILAFGVLALAVSAVVQVLKGKTFSANFVKLFGLVFIATLAAAIIFADVENEARTGAYTVLGTIAGYLAGSRAQSTDPKDGEVKDLAENSLG